MRNGKMTVKPKLNEKLKRSNAKRKMLEKHAKNTLNL